LREFETATFTCQFANLLVKSKDNVYTVSGYEMIDRVSWSTIPYCYL